MATSLLVNHMPWHAARHAMVTSQGQRTTLKWMLALAGLLAMALARAADPAMGGSTVTIIFVGYAGPVVVMCCVVWATVVDGMALQARLGQVPAVGEAIVPDGVVRGVVEASPPKTPARATPSASRALRQAVARCEDAERRAQQAAGVALGLLMALGAQRAQRI